MKSNAKRLSVLILCLILAYSFTGCSVVTVNTERDQNQVVANIGDTKILKKDALARYEISAAQYGISSTTSSDTVTSLKKNILDEMVETEVIWQIAKQKGLEQKLTDAEKAEIEKDYSDTIDYIKTQYTSSESTSTPTATASATASPSAADLDAFVDEFFAEYGYTKETYKQYLYVSKYEEMLQTEIEAEVTDVSEEDLKAAYESELTTQKKNFDAAETSTSSSSSTTSYEYYEENGKVIVYVPSGLAYYKHILIAFPSDISTQIETVQNDTSLSDEEIEEKVDTLKTQGYGQIQSKAEEVLSKVKSGEDFDTLIATYGEDPGMTSDTYKTTGYLVGKQSSFVTEFKNACLALSNVGDTSELVKSDYGYHIIKKVSVLASGEKSYDEVKDALKAQVLEEKKSDHWDETLENWKKELNVTVYYDRL